MVNENKILNIVKVRYFSETTKELSPREYTYFSEDALHVGDVVTVPVRDTTGKAQVSAINVPEAEISAFRDKVKTIPATVKPELPAGGLDEAAQAAGAEVKVVDLFSATYGNFAETLPAIDIVTDKMDVALININPRDNPVIAKLQEEIIKLSNYSMGRVIKCDTDLTPAGDDLILISKLKKALKAKQEEYVGPIKSHLDKVQFVFKDLLGCLDDLEKNTKAKMQTYTDAQKARAAEAERLNREAVDLARKQAEFSGTGEFTVNTIPLEAPAPVKHISTGSGTISEVKAPPTWEIIDEALIPKEYWQLDTVKINRIVRAGGSIAGIKVTTHTGLRTNTK